MKLTLGFEEVFNLLAIVTGVGFHAQSSGSDNSQNYRQLVHKTNIAGRVQANILSIRLAALRIINIGNKEALKGQVVRWNQLHNFMKDSTSEVTKVERRAVLGKSEDDLLSYDKTLTSASLDQNQRFSYTKHVKRQNH